MKKIILIMLVLPFLMSTTCERESNTCHKNIVFENKTDKTLYANWSLDTVGYNLHLVDKMRIVKPYTTGNIATSDCYENRFEYQSFSGILSIFVLDNEVVSTVPRNDIIKYKMYLKRYDVTLDDLQRMNWTIVYTGE